MDKSRYNSIPFITYGCIAICIVVFIAEIVTAGASYYVSPIISDFGTEQYIVLVKHQYWRLITAGFVHLSWWHIAMNMYALYMMGREIEPNIGHVKYALLLLLSIISGNLAVCMMSSSLAVGMSTGLYGLMLYEIVKLGRTYGFKTIWRDNGIRYTIVVNLVMNFLPGISWQGHFGGAIVGIIFGLLL